MQCRLNYRVANGAEFLFLFQGDPLWHLVGVGAKHIFFLLIPQGVQFLDAVIFCKLSYDSIHQFFRSSIEVSVLLFALGFCQPVRELHQHRLHLGIVKVAVVDGIHDLSDAVPAFLPELVTKISLLLIDLQQILAEDFLGQIALDGFDTLGGEVGFVGIDGVSHHMNMRMVTFVVECGVPAEVLRRDLHLLRDHVSLRTKQVHPCVRVVIAQPFRILTAEGDDVCPDIAGVFVHLFLHLGQNDGDTFVCEQTVAAGALIDVPEIHIPLGSVTMQLHDVTDESIRIATSRVC